MRRRWLLVVSLLCCFSVGIAGAAAADVGGRQLTTELTGAAEVPGPGDPDAFGTAAVTLNQGLGDVCFELSWENIDGTVFAAHIHSGTVEEAGPVVVTLFTGAFSGTDTASDCVEGVDSALVKAIRQEPTSYYVNVHSTQFPAGAIRGQLSR
jgi:hypothetical protein